MRWKKPQVNDIRIIKRFLFLPKEIHNEYRWLEIAYIKQECVQGFWIDTEWLSGTYHNKSSCINEDKKENIKTILFLLFMFLMLFIFIYGAIHYLK
ncbi:uncharacterized protein CBO05P1_269 [Clostridium botulinum B str. Osaka05]|uniref:Uncharacterized protein n=1 Tax=Clostridium botulinum B str. Osaka05 TaxID=1407017 RepID=A0A060N8W9_CLOBO|nr:hypothetical protein [Clostridium botulinum]BAO04988.1 uncharacterized protein CBO05P1_269 [Clostridium botulinum B str. Osaka05]